jgi:hypothetical protein
VDGMSQNLGPELNFSEIPRDYLAVYNTVTPTGGMRLFIFKILRTKYLQNIKDK